MKASPPPSVPPPSVPPPSSVFGGAVHSRYIFPTSPVATKFAGAFKPNGSAQSMFEFPESPDIFEATT